MNAVVPRHGNGLLRQWQPGQSGNPSGYPKVLAEALALARTAAPAMIRRLIDLANDSPDDRTQAMAAVKVLEFSGLANLAGLPDSGGQPLDLTHLTAAERAELAAALAVQENRLNVTLSAGSVFPGSRRSSPRVSGGFWC